MSKKSWRDVIKVHEAADLFPMLDPEQLDQLAADIQKNGLLQPVTIYVPPYPDATPVLIDGRNRLDALQQLGKIRVRNDRVEFEGWASGQWLRLSHATHIVKLDSKLARDDPYAYVASLNVHRRHLSREQKREAVEKILAANPAVSDRRIGKVVGVDGKTVGAVRGAMERRAEIPHVSLVTDTKGRQQPVDRKVRLLVSTEKITVQRMQQPQNDPPASPPLQLSGGPISPVIRCVMRHREFVFELARAIPAESCTELIAALRGDLADIEEVLERRRKEQGSEADADGHPMASIEAGVIPRPARKEQSND